MLYPKISIVTPSFNQGKYLEETILSIVNQKYPNLEYIIIDGGSTDNSVAIIRKYENHLAYWVSEKDKGQSHAINKGLKKVTGDLFNWINSDDYLEDGALMKAAKAYNENPDKKLFCFALYNLRGNEKTLFPVYNNPEDKIQCFAAPAINQQAAFYTKEAVNFLGEVNEKLHFTMDYEWMLKYMFHFGTGSMYVSKDAISVYRLHDESKSLMSHERFLNDIASVLNSLCEKTGLKQFSDMLKDRFTVSPDYIFSVDVSGRKIVVERMAVYFLLKWSRAIYSKNHFDFAKKLIKEIDFTAYDITIKEKDWLLQLGRNVSSPNWTLHRIKRKLISK